MPHQPPTPIPVILRELDEGWDAVQRAAGRQGEAPPELCRFVAEVQWTWRLVEDPPDPLPAAAEAVDGVRVGAAAIAGRPVGEIAGLGRNRLDDLRRRLAESAEPNSMRSGTTVATPEGVRDLDVVMAGLAVKAQLAASLLDPEHTPRNPAAVVSLARAVEASGRGPFAAISARRLSWGQRRAPWAAFVASNRRGSRTDR